MVVHIDTRFWGTSDVGLEPFMLLVRNTYMYIPGIYLGPGANVTELLLADNFA